MTKSSNPSSHPAVDVTIPENVMLRFISSAHDALASEETVEVDELTGFLWVLDQLPASYKNNPDVDLIRRSIEDNRNGILEQDKHPQYGV